MDPAVTRRVRAPCISCNTRPTLLKIFTSILTYVHKIYVHSQIYSLVYSRLRGRGPGPGFQIVTGGHSKHGQTFFFHVCVFTKLCKALYNDDQANILVNESSRACLADFGLSTVVGAERRAAAITSLISVASNVSLMSFTAGGTTRWMSPELLDPDQFGVTDCRPTKQSDCYALGMVVYEVRLIIPTHTSV